jgi:hypothetical protein
VGDGLGEGVNVGRLVTVGLAVGLVAPGEAVAAGVNDAAAWDWQAAVRTIIKPDIRFRRTGNDVLRMFISTTRSPRHKEYLASDLKIDFHAWW